MNSKNPAGWSQQLVGDVATLQRGFDLPVQDRVPGSVAIFAANGPVGTHNVAKVQGPGVVTGRSGTLGEVRYVEDDFWPLNTSLWVTDFHGNDVRWVARLLTWLRLDRFSRGSGVPTLNRNLVHAVPAFVPPLDEQRRIAAILDKADAIRRKHREAIALTEQLLRSTFLEMFGDPVTNPKGWPVVQFGLIGTLDRGKSKHRPRNDPALLGGPYPLIQTGDVSNSAGVIREYSQTYSEFGLRQSRIWPAGTLCITIAANIARTGLLTFDACFPDSVVGFHPGPSITTEFVQGWLGFLQPILEERAPQVAQKNINLEILRALEIPTPPLSLLQQHARAVAQIRANSQRAQFAANEADTLFHSLVQRAFRGDL